MVQLGRTRDELVQCLLGSLILKGMSQLLTELVVQPCTAGLVPHLVQLIEQLRHLTTNITVIFHLFSQLYIYIINRREKINNAY